MIIKSIIPVKVNDIIFNGYGYGDGSGYGNGHYTITLYNNNSRGPFFSSTSIGKVKVKLISSIYFDEGEGKVDRFDERLCTRYSIYPHNYTFYYIINELKIEYAHG